MCGMYEHVSFSSGSVEILGSTDIVVGDWFALWGGFKRLGFQTVLEDGGDGFERTGVKHKRTFASCIQAFLTRAPQEVENATQARIPCSGRGFLRNTTSTRLAT